MEDFRDLTRHEVDLPASAGLTKEEKGMSEERGKKIHNANEEDERDDVEAHKKGGRFANDEGDDVEAHKKGGRFANDDGDDDVEAHVKASRL
jgi:hypothetical protein